MEEERTNGNELKTELKRIRTQIIRLQKKRLGQKDKIAFAHYRISDLEQIIEKIQAPLGSTRHLPWQVLYGRSISHIRWFNETVIRILSKQCARKDKGNISYLLLKLMDAFEFQENDMPSNGNRASYQITWTEYAEENNVTFATGTLTDDALSWWNAHAQPMGIEQANQITWTELKRLLTNKYCPRTEIKKMEDEFYGLTVNGSDLKTYIRRFQELAFLCPNMVPNSEKLMEAFIGGLPQSIEGNVTASKPQTLEEATNIAHRLMDQIIKRNSVQETNDHKRKFDDRRNTTNNNNYPNNNNYSNNRDKDNYPNDRNNNNHSNNHINKNNYPDNHNNNNRNNDHHQQQNGRQEIFKANGN
ncbi:reverse transcriptase domain-containing protein [Tanacetum coccineum]